MSGYAHLRPVDPKQGRRKPLRTFAEMAEEFGVKSGTLSGLIRSRGGPKPKLFRPYMHRTWYDPDALRQWWASIHNEDGSLKKLGE